MSTAKDEAEIGRKNLEDDEENSSEKLEKGEDEEEKEEEGDEDELPRSLSGPVPLELMDMHGDEDNLSAESVPPRIRNGHGSNSPRNFNTKSSLDVGRPSSADGSLSIPDDTPSIQVKLSGRGLLKAIDWRNSNLEYHLLAETRAPFLIIQVLPRRYALLTVDSKLEVRIFLSSRLELFRQLS